MSLSFAFRRVVLPGSRTLAQSTMSVRQMGARVEAENCLGDLSGGPSPLNSCVGCERTDSHGGVLPLRNVPQRAYKPVERTSEQQQYWVVLPERSNGPIPNDGLVRARGTYRKDVRKKAGPASASPTTAGPTLQPPPPTREGRVGGGTFAQA